MELIKKYKWFILGFIVIFVLLIGWLFKDIFLSSDGPLYGDRLQGIDDVKITSDEQKNVKDLLLQTAGIKKVNTNVQGKIFYVVIYVDETITVDNVKAACNSSLEKLTSEEKGFYDISFLIDYEKESEATNFPISGSKSKNSNSIVW
jgi:hypothetical protein